MKNKVLIVDDELIICEVAKDIIEMMNIESFTAQSLEDAVSCYRKHQNEIAVVILDYHLQETSGIDILNAIKEINDDFIPVLASGSYLLEEKSRLFEHGFREILSKPYCFDEMKKLLIRFKIL